MIISELLAYVDAVKPNSFDTPTKIIWLNEVEGMVETDIMLVASADIITYAATDTAVTLLVPAPHDKLYRSYLCAMIDFANGEYTKYNNTMQMFNTHYRELVEWYARVYRPADGIAVWQGYYISAYGIAVSHGYVGDEVAWLLTLKGETGPATFGVDGVDGTNGTNGTNGAAGTNGTAGTNGIRGSRINQGTTITGTVATGTVFASSGITDALINDTYINNAAWNVYKCLLGGVAVTATWSYIGNIKGVDGAGAGDMLKATYDTTNNGVVDNAEKVNNHTVDTDVPTGAVFTDTVPSTTTATLTVVGWAANSQTPTAAGVTATKIIWVAPAPASQDAYVAAGIICTAQAAGTLTFTCVTVPAVAITVNVILAGV